MYLFLFWDFACGFQTHTYKVKNGARHEDRYQEHLQKRHLIIATTPIMCCSRKENGIDSLHIASLGAIAKKRSCKGFPVLAMRGLCPSLN